MPKDDPICPNCTYSLQGHAPIDQADPNGTAKITCPECGRSTTLNHALTATIPSKHPILATFLAILIILALTVGCCTALWQGLFYWTLGSK